MWKKVLHILLNKYLLTSLGFLVWLLFFDSNNLLIRMKLHNQLKELHHEKAFYLEEIQRDSLMIQKLTADTAEIERFAREKYLMKKEDEDVFLMVDTSEKTPVR